MGDFADSFNRADAASVKNNWRFCSRRDLAGESVKPWKILNNKAQSSDTNGIDTLMFRTPINPSVPYKVTWAFNGTANAEAFIRMNGVKGAGRERLSVVIVGGSGSIRRRRNNGAPNVSFDNVLASWGRASTTLFTIVVEVDGDSITVYDSGFVGPNHLAASITSHINYNRTGVGVGSGALDAIAVDNIDAYADQEFSFAPAEIRLTASLNLTVKHPEGYAGDLEVNDTLLGLAVEDYVIRNGEAGVLPGGYIRLDSRLENEVLSTSLLLDPATVDMGSDYRWLPTSATFDAAGVPNEWQPSVGVRTQRTWFVKRDAIATQAQALAQSQGRDAMLNLNYSYFTPLGRVHRPAVCFDGHSYMQLYVPAPPTTPPPTTGFTSISSDHYSGPETPQAYLPVALGTWERLEHIVVSDNHGHSVYYLPKGHPYYPRGGWFASNALGSVLLSFVTSGTHSATKIVPTYHSPAVKLHVLADLQASVASTLTITTYSSAQFVSPAALIDARRTYASPLETDTGTCVAVVAVLHPGSGKEYGVVHTDLSKRQDEPGVPLAISYAKGRFSARGGSDLVRGEARNGAQEATVMLLNLDLGGDKGTFMVQGRKTLNKRFSLTGVEAFADGMFFGAMISYADQFSPDLAADMDVLEIDLWDRALPLHERLSVVHRLCAAYGVRT